MCRILTKSNIPEMKKEEKNKKKMKDKCSQKNGQKATQTMAIFLVKYICQLKVVGCSL